MASDIKATSQNEDVPEKEAPETAPDGPLLDLSDAAVKKLIRSVKKRGYVTHDQINSVLSSEEVNSEQMEDVLAMLGRATARRGRRRGGERGWRSRRSPAEGPRQGRGQGADRAH
jgi:Sigma-70 factor, region 1.1